MRDGTSEINMACYILDISFFTRVSPYSFTIIVFINNQFILEIIRLNNSQIITMR